MANKYQKLINESVEFLGESVDPAHGIIHAKSVAKHALEISENYSEVDKDLIELCAYWHDDGRLLNPVHEQASAGMLFEALKEFGEEEEICKKAYNAVAFHKWNMTPITIEGEIIRDADKLDFISIDRWKAAIEKNSFKHLEDMTELLPKLRNEILHLQESKIIYDRLITSFNEFVRSQNNMNFDSIRSRVLEYQF
ncbi:MAG: HD domain-containing protein [Patescibacteria group bacterium]